jgi:hypothetical protein
VGEDDEDGCEEEGGGREGDIPVVASEEGAITISVSGGNTLLALPGTGPTFTPSLENGTCAPGILSTDDDDDEDEEEDEDEDEEHGGKARGDLG